MKIISQFRDYYDSVSHQYLDKEILYLREKREIEVSRKDAKDLYPKVEEFHRYNSYLRNKDGEMEVSCRYLGFCGKVFPLIVMKPRLGDTLKLCFYSFEAFKEWAEETKLTLDPGKPRWWWRDTYHLKHLDEYKRFFDNKERLSALEAKFLELSTPVFVYMETNSQERKFLVNPTLKYYSFAKVKDPFTAHQELYQFVSGFLKQPERPMVEISDKDKASKHGFDKWSFRQKGPKK